MPEFSADWRLFLMSRYLEEVQAYGGTRLRLPQRQHSPNCDYP